MDKLIHKECVVIDLEVGSKESIIKELIKLLEAKDLLINELDFLNVILEREKIFPTSIGKMIAIPHGIDQSVKEASLCVARLKKPVLWDDEKNEYVSLVILIAVPLENTSDNTHIQIISCLMRNLMHDEYINQLLKSDKEAIFRLLKEGFDNDKKTS